MSASSAFRPRSSGWDVYFRPRVAVMLLLGFSSGLPFFLTGTGALMQAWLTETGVSLQHIGLFGLVALAYGWKFLWAPAIDGFAIPLLSRRLGHRRAWLLVIQVGLMIAIIGLGQVDPATQPVLLVVIAVIVAFLSASQDIVADAFRIESLEESEVAAGTANFIAAYRVALLVAFTGAVAFIAWCESSGMSEQEAWSAGYTLMGALMGVGIAGTLLARENWLSERTLFRANPGKRFRNVVLEPFREFIRKDSWWVILIFVAVFRLSDVFTAELNVSFFLRMGFETATYAALSWPFGFFSSMAGGFAGGYFAHRLGLMRALWIVGIAQMITSLVFLWPVFVLPDITAQIGIPDEDGVRRLTFGALDAGGEAGLWAIALMAVPIAIKQFAAGAGVVIFTAYISQLCGNRAYTATQYALLSSFAAQARVSLSAPSGFLAAGLGWGWYYIIATALAVPGLVLLGWLGQREKRKAAA